MVTRPIQIVKNGTAAAVTIPRPMLRALGWALGDFLIPEVLEDRSIRFRPPMARDFAPERLQPFFSDPVDKGKP